jgi:GntR family transcriptional regulator
MAKELSRKPTDDNRTLFARVADSLRNDILTNRMVPGHKLPSESALEGSFGVSRITVRQALASLHAEGLIEKVNGKGSFVTRPNELPDMGPLTGFYEHMRKQGRQAVGRILSVREVSAPVAAAQALEVPVGHPLVALRSLRLVDGKPLAFVLAYGEPALMRALIQEDVNTNDVVVLLETRLGHRLRSNRIEARAIPASAALARLLDVARGAPLLRIDFTPVDVSGQSMVYSEMFFRGDSFSYKAVVKR